MPITALIHARLHLKVPWARKNLCMVSLRCQGERRRIARRSWKRVDWACHSRASKQVLHESSPPSPADGAGEDRCPEQRNCRCDKSDESIHRYSRFFWMNSSELWINRHISSSLSSPAPAITPIRTAYRWTASSAQRRRVQQTAPTPLTIYLHNVEPAVYRVDQPHIDF